MLGALSHKAGLLGGAHKRAYILVCVSKAHDLNVHMTCLQLSTEDTLNYLHSPRVYKR